MSLCGNQNLADAHLSLSLIVFVVDAGFALQQSTVDVAEEFQRLRAHTEIHRHEYRDAVWFILADASAGRSHRFSPAAYRFIGLMDGECKGATGKM